jgi:hypothetical protein
MDEAYYDDPFENEYEPDLFSVNGTITSEGVWRWNEEGDQDLPDA